MFLASSFATKVIAGPPRKLKGAQPPCGPPASSHDFPAIRGCIVESDSPRPYLALAIHSG
jgi:hypothetical protein